MHKFCRLILPLLLAVFFSPLLRADTAPPWTLKDLRGKTVSLSDFKGKIVVLDFWATWCAPCVFEIPNFVALQKKYKNKGVTVIGASVDSLVPAEIARFAKEHEMNYPIVMADEATAQAYGTDLGIPFTIVIDKHGQVVARHLGLTDLETLEDDISKARAN